MRLKFFMLLAAAMYACNAFGAIKLPAIFSDNMVLQQKSRVPVWGWASPGETIKVTGSWDKETKTARADREGKWMIRLQTPAAGGPYTVNIKGRESVLLHNVLIGEVWVCSGQSNMEMPVSGWPGAPVLNSKAEISAADFPAIRMFTVQRDVALVPQQDCKGTWDACTPQTVAGFSATAYFFGRELYKKLKVPIGLIHTSWGGTVAEAWTSGTALRKLGDFDQALNEQDSIAPHLGKIKEQDARELRAWDEAVGKVNSRYAAMNDDDAGWKHMLLPATWESAGLPDFDGVVWFRKVIEVPASWAGKALHLDLGPIDDQDITWFNGQKVGGIMEDGYWAKNRSYEVPGRLVRPGKNIVAVRVLDTKGNGGIYGDARLMQLYPAGRPEEKISLAGDWRYKAALKKPQTRVNDNPNTPAVLYNGMIAPLIPYAIRGAIWYQGEANVGRAAQYTRLFPAMITDWRTRWQEGDFPFYFVQIAPYPYGHDGRQSAALRDAQRRTLALPQTGMAVTLDIGDTTNIHPANKEAVGRRLSLWALAKTYGVSRTAYSGPLYKSMKVEGNKAIISFDHADDGLEARGGELKDFEVAGEDGRFVPGQATIEGNKVVVSSDQVSRPAAVRYAWRDNDVPHLFNRAGLPASVFTTAGLDH